MRIVYVLTSLGMGGAERQTLALAARMASRGHTVALLVLLPPLDEEWSTALSVTHLNMRKTPASLCAGLFQARRFLKDFRPGLVPHRPAVFTPTSSPASSDSSGRASPSYQQSTTSTKAVGRACSPIASLTH